MTENRPRTDRLIRRIAPPVASGTLFGAGLAISGMTDPSRVKGFLDIFGQWDPTLAFVMAGAVLVTAIAWRIRQRMPRPLFGPVFAFPTRRDIDAPLVIGAIMFGVGWGLAGLCPGPAVAALALRPLAILPFIAAMLAGMVAHRLVFEPSPPSQSKASR